MLCEILEPIQTRRGILQAGTHAEIPSEVFLKLAGKVRRIQNPRTAKPFDELACGSCIYFGWQGVDHYCRHPNNDRLIAGDDCSGKNYIDRYTKIPPTKKRDWPEPIDITERNYKHG